jgi:dihydroorotase
MMAASLAQAHAADLPFLAHLELLEVSRRAVMTAGPVAEALGVPGQSPEAESQALLRWVQAADGIARLHLLHLTTAATARLLHYLRPGPFFQRISGETAPHYLLLTAEAVRRWGADAKMNPPLREERDRLALLGALRNGDIEVLATDHAPHAPAEKARGLTDAPFGITGLETALALTITHLVNTGHVTLLQALGKMSVNPARLLADGGVESRKSKVESGEGRGGGTLEPGAPADLTIIDLHKHWTVDPAEFRSKGRATPFAGERLVGKAWGTIVGGEWRMREGEVL